MPLSETSAITNPHPVLVDAEEVVEVATDLAGRRHLRMHVEVFGDGQRGGQDGCLYLARHDEFLPKGHKSVSGCQCIF